MQSGAYCHNDYECLIGFLCVPDVANQTSRSQNSGIVTWALSPSSDSTTNKCTQMYSLVDGSWASLSELCWSGQATGYVCVNITQITWNNLVLAEPYSCQPNASLPCIYSSTSLLGTSDPIYSLPCRCVMDGVQSSGVCQEPL